MSDKLSNVVLCVEDTNRGHWNHQESKIPRHYPVVSIAQTKLKQFENRLIGHSIVRSISQLPDDFVPGFSSSFADGHVGVIAYGGIGSSVCAALKDASPLISLSVYEQSPERSALAKADGFKIVDRKTLLAKSNVIISCAGRPTINSKDLPYLKDGVILFSGSSKQIEFEELLSIPARFAHDLIDEITIEGKKLRVAYKGQPINFLDKLPPEDFDFLMAGLVQCVKFGLENMLANQIYDLPVTYQEPIIASI